MSFLIGLARKYPTHAGHTFSAMILSASADSRGHLKRKFFPGRKESLGLVWILKFILINPPLYRGTHKGYPIREVSSMLPLGSWTGRKGAARRKHQPGEGSSQRFYWVSAFKPPALPEVMTLDQRCNILCL
jgi:hypothetical protein